MTRTPFHTTTSTKKSNVLYENNSKHKNYEIYVHIHILYCARFLVDYFTLKVKTYKDINGYVFY